MAWEYIQEKDHMNLYLLYLFLTMGHFRPLFGYLSFQLYNQNENKIHQKFQETGELPRSGLWATQTCLSLARRTCGRSWRITPRPGSGSRPSPRRDLRSTRKRRSKKVNNLKVFIWLFPAPFFLYFRLFDKVINTVDRNKITDGWIRTTVLWYWKQALYQLRHNHCP